MAIYVSTFISGFHEVIKEMMSKYLKNSQIIDLFDGLVVYKSEADINRIRQVEFFTNSFILIKEFKSEKDFIEDLEKIELTSLNEYIKKYKTFRIVFSQENQIVPTSTTAVPLEKRIYKELNLKLDIIRPDYEFWFLKRSEGKCLFMLRLTKGINSGLNKGEFRQDLAFILNYISEPNRNDIFMEPFAGYGSVTYARAKYFPPKLIVINDLDKKYNGFWNQKLDSFKNLEIVRKNQDALNFKTEHNSSVHRIVADPPWGDFEKINNIKEFYAQMLKEFDRILKQNGILILVTSKKEEFEEILKEHNNLFLLKKFNILVNGKKACVYKILKRVNLNT